MFLLYRCKWVHLHIFSLFYRISTEIARFSHHLFYIFIIIYIFIEPCYTVTTFYFFVKRGYRMSRPIHITARRILSVLLSLSLGIAGLCLIGGCLYIYFGEGAYSRELVATVFNKIAVPVWIAVGMVVISILWELCIPADRERCKAPKAYSTMLIRLHQTRDTSEHESAVRAQQHRRKLFVIVRTVLILAGLLMFFGYAVQPANYTEDINASVIRAMWVAIPCFAVPFVFSVVAAYQIGKSYEAEIALLKSCPTLGTAKELSPPADKPDTVVTVLRILLLALAVAALVYGFTAGGTVDVLTKAINICTECIGLG